MSISSLHADLESKLSPGSTILTDSSGQSFKDHLIRWGKVNLEVPGAILLPKTEDDVIIIVQYAVTHSIPFVCCCGGHSTWSTIGKEGFILDFSLQKDFQIDPDAETVRIQPGVLTKELNTGVAQRGFCVATSNARSVGVIPAILGGGFSAISSIHGLGIDNLLSVRIMTPTRGLVIASESSNADLFWAIRGAGQAFGVVTEVTLKLHPLNTLSADDGGKFWLFTFIYSQDKLEAFAATLETMSKNMSERAMGVAFMASPPPAFEPRFIVTTQFFGTETAARSALAPFFSIDPVVVQKHITFDQISDSSDQLDAKGGYKYITSTGMRMLEAEKLLNAFKYGLDMLVKHPELKKSILGTTFFNPGVMARVPDESTAWGHRDIVGWAFNAAVILIDSRMAVPFTDDAASFPLAEKYAEDFLEYLRESEKIAAFPNHTRSRGAHERYPGEWRVKKLQRLKQEWDPAGVFPQDFHS